MQSSETQGINPVGRADGLQTVAVILNLFFWSNTMRWVQFICFPSSFPSLFIPKVRLSLTEEAYNLTAEHSLLGASFAASSTSAVVSFLYSLN